MGKIRTSYHFDADTLDRIRAYSDKTGVPQALVIRRAMRFYIEILEGKPLSQVWSELGSGILPLASAAPPTASSRKTATA
jgi:predicted DNA-binding protein